MMKPYAIGLDLGGTKIAAGLVTQQGDILHRYSTKAHSEQPPDYVMNVVEQSCRALLETSGVNVEDIEAVGLGFPGTANGPAGIVLISSNLPAWDHFPLRDTLSRRLGLPVVMDNDANLCAMGEYRYGAGRGTSTMCYMTVSTGLGLGIIINGQLHVGNTGTAGELGHVIIDIGGPRCTCGKKGCVMAYASGIGLSRMAYEQIAAGAKTSLCDVAPADRRRISGEQIAAAAAGGDEVARRIVSTAGYYCGVALSMIVQIINPELIVIGGGLTRIGTALLEPAMAAMREHTQPELWDSVRVEPWQLGDDLGIIGAAAKVFADAEARLERAG